MKNATILVAASLVLGISMTLSVAQNTGSAERPPLRGGAGGRGAGGMRGNTQMAFQVAPVAKDEAEKKILEVLDEINRNRGMSVPRDDGRLLRILVESTGAKQVVELGTFRGYSGIWICLGLRTTAGKLTTFEIDPNNAKISLDHFKRAQVDSLVTIVEGDAHKEVAKLKDPIDLVFIDADKEGYLDYLNQLLPLLKPGGLVVAHNINPGMADPNFIKAITTNPALDSICVSAGSDGISISIKKR